MEKLIETLLRTAIQHAGAERGVLVTASTDLGNVSQKLPTDWIRFPVTDRPIAGHSDAMREASVSDLAHRNALLVVEALGAAAHRVASDMSLRRSIAGDVKAPV